MIEKIDEKLRDTIITYPSSQVKVIVEATGDPNLLKNLVESNGGIFLGKALNYAAVKIKAGLIKDLIKNPQIARFWYIDHRIFDPYFNAIDGIEYILSFVGKPDCPKVVNMSLSPPIDRPGELRFDPNEPFNVATKKLFDNGILPVLAVGNFGRMGNDTLNPWSVAPWVVGVGAATKDGKKLADFSSRGIPGHKLYKPTIVAPGVDIETAHPTNVKKTPKQLQKDKKFLSKDKLNSRTIGSGTSFAASNISKASANIIRFMSENLIPRQIGFKANLVNVINFTFRGYTKTVSYEYGIPDSSSPAKIKELLIKLAIPMPKYQTHEVGAGFLNRAIVAKLFGYTEPRHMAIKILRDKAT